MSAIGDHPSIVHAELNGLDSIDDEATTLTLDATYASVPLEVVANRRRQTVTIEVGREVRELDVAEAYKVAAAILAGTAYAAPPPPDQCVDCGANTEAADDAWGAPLCGVCQDARTEAWQ